MTEKRRQPARDVLRPAAQILADLRAPEPSRREQALTACWDLLPDIEPILAALLHGLNDPDEGVRLQAAKGFLLAFPSAEPALSPFLSEIESNDPKVRLAAIGRIITILASALTVLSDVTPEDSSTTGKQPEPVMEDRMGHTGQWVAWTRDRQRIVAVADSFADVMAQALAAGEPDPYVKKAPGVSPTTARKAFAILEHESADVLDDVRKVFPDPDAWLDAPNDLLGGERPRDLIRTGREQEVRYLLRGIEDGITT